MSKFGELEAAFAAYQKSLISDEQLRLIRDRTRDAIETLVAMGEDGLVVFALRLKLNCYESMIQARKS